MSTSLFFNDSLWAAATAVLGAVAAASGCWALYLANLSAKAKDDSFERYQKASALAISSANARAEEAKATAESFKRDIAQANEKAAAAQEESAKFNAIAEQERLARLRIEERMAPRSITEEQRVHILRELEKAPKALVDIIGVGESWEISELCAQIAETLTEAGWTVQGTWYSMGGLQMRAVVVSTSAPLTESKEKVKFALLQALAGTGIRVGVGPDFEGASHVGIGLSGPPITSYAPVRVYVGEKP